MHGFALFLFLATLTAVPAPDVAYCVTGRGGADNGHAEVCQRHKPDFGWNFGEWYDVDEIPTEYWPVARRRLDHGGDRKHVCYPVDEQKHGNRGCPSDMDRKTAEWVYPLFPQCDCSARRGGLSSHPADYSDTRMCSKVTADGNGELTSSTCTPKASTYHDDKQADERGVWGDADAWYGCAGDMWPCHDNDGYEACSGSWNCDIILRLAADNHAYFDANGDGFVDTTEGPDFVQNCDYTGDNLVSLCEAEQCNNDYENNWRYYSCSPFINDIHCHLSCVPNWGPGGGPYGKSKPTKEQVVKFREEVQKRKK